MEIIDAICELVGRFIFWAIRKTGVLADVKISHGGYTVVGYLTIAGLFFAFIAWWGAQ